LRAFIDTNVFIYAIELHPTFGETAGRVLGMVDSGELEGVTSSLVILEVCWYLEHRRRLREMREAVNLITGSKVRVEDVRQRDILDALEDKTEYRDVDLNDLINYNVMRRQGLELIITNDVHFSRLPGVETSFKA
jgi:predicted nucleic acid-binding protein